MSEFEFLSLLISIVFGLGLTHLVYGLFRHLARRDVTEVHALYTTWAFMVIVLNWWALYQWRDYQPWSFEVFLIVIVWATSFYMVSIALYPPDDRKASLADFDYRWFHWAALATGAIDVVWTATRGALFTPWYYLPFVGHYIVLFALLNAIKAPAFRRVAAWWIVLSILTWAFVVRRFAT